MMLETVFGVGLGSALAAAGWALVRVARVEDMDKKIDHVISRVDFIYEHLISRSR